VKELGLNEGITFLKNGNRESLGPCGISLEDTIDDPVIFDKCKHAFCCACLVRFQKATALSDPEDKGSRCPYCRAEIPNLIQSTHAKVCVIIARVTRGDLSDKERKELASKALTDLQMLWDTGDPGLKMNLTHTRATLLSYCGDYKAALKTLKEAIPVFTEMAERGAMAVALLEKCQREDLDVVEEATKRNLAEPGSGLLKTDLVGLYFEIAKVQQKLEDWQAAWDTLQYICDNFQFGSEMTIHQQMEVFLSSQQCANQMKAYMHSIQFGEAIMDQNRFYPTVHKATAIAYRELGNIEQARKLAAGAILYEAPWDEENKRKNWEFWREFT
jgi:tetratricopeptide (TPR) repeat protein